MDEQEYQHLAELRRIHQRRLDTLEQQAAFSGSSSPPQVLMEIEDIRGQIAEIEKRLAARDLPMPQLPGRQTISVLFLSSDPGDGPRLRLGEELREIQEQLQLAKLRDRFELELRMSARPRDLTRALLEVQPDLVHFSGHGTKAGAICFETLEGEIHPVEPDTLAALFRQFAEQVQCVVLNACYTEIQAQSIARHINWVIGMNQAISDNAALSFSIGFYQALGAGRRIEDAYEFGCIQIRLQGIPEHLVPVLVRR